MLLATNRHTKRASNVSLQDLDNSKAQLQAAIYKSHGSHTADWLRETAAACIDIGLQESDFGLQMLPISYQHLAARMQATFPEPQQLLNKMQSTTGEKYFTLSGPSETPSTVALKLDSIIHTPGRTADVDGILSSIHGITEQLNHCTNSKTPLLRAGYSTPSHNGANDSSAGSDTGTIDVSTAFHWF